MRTRIKPPDHDDRVQAAADLFQIEVDTGRVTSFLRCAEIYGVESYEVEKEVRHFRRDDRSGQSGRGGDWCWPRPEVREIRTQAAADLYQMTWDDPRWRGRGLRPIAKRMKVSIRFVIAELDRRGETRRSNQGRPRWRR